jgi:hypothetical protein
MNADIMKPSRGQVPDVSIATTDIVISASSILKLNQQLDSFNEKDAFLGRFRMLGRTERRRGGTKAHVPFFIYTAVKSAVWSASMTVLENHQSLCGLHFFRLTHVTVKMYS